jgi:hypothetical protein
MKCALTLMVLAVRFRLVELECSFLAQRFVL